MIMHTDQDSEFTAGDFRSACIRCGMKQSMDQPGSTLDNAVTESWNSTLEFELRCRTLRQEGAGPDGDGGMDR
ncbi:transposase InsO family protein [Arthrobacter sp. UYEF21]